MIVDSFQIKFGLLLSHPLPILIVEGYRSQKHNGSHQRRRILSQSYPIFGMCLSSAHKG